MLWILQQNFYSEPNYDVLMETLPRMGLPVLRVKPVPFTHQLLPFDYDTSKASDLSQVPEPEIDSANGVVVCGSYTLAKIAKDRGWSPGAWIDNLDYLTWSRQWRPEHLLNPDAWVGRFEDAEVSEKRFVRPVADSKAFAGKVFDPHEWAAFRKGALEATAAATDPSLLPLTADTEVLVAAPVEIWNETRLFVVDGKIVTGSVYKRGSKVVYDDYLDTGVLWFAEALIDAWQPDDAFVLDVAYTPAGYKVVELNCLNAAGFYACDVQKLVVAIEAMSDN